MKLAAIFRGWAEAAAEWLCPELKVSEDFIFADRRNPMTGELESVDLDLPILKEIRKRMKEKK